jgi:hypothetical protein
MISFCYRQNASHKSITYTLVGQNGSTIDVKLILDGDVVTKNGDVLYSGPSTDARVPSDDRAHDPGVVSDGSVSHDDTSLKPDTRSDLGSRSDDDVGSDQSGGVDLGRLMVVGTVRTTLSEYCLAFKPERHSQGRPGRFHRVPTCFA